MDPVTPAHVMRRLRCTLLAQGSILLASCALAQETPAESALITALRAEASAYERGNGVVQDGKRAAALYCEAARLGDAKSQFDLGWIYANGRGVDRNDSLAAFYFQAAAEQGYEQAARMLRTVGGPTTEVPLCMRAPEVAPPKVAAPPGEPQPASAEVRSSAPKPIVELASSIASEYNVQPQLVLAIMEAESNFDIVALSPKNAKGLMQLIPETAARFSVKNVYDPAQNIRGGVAYLRWLLAYFEGDITLVAAAYNAGERAVERYRGVPPYLETRAYVLRILRAFGAADHPFDVSVTPPSPQLPLIRDPKRAG